MSQHVTERDPRVGPGPAVSSANGSVTGHANGYGPAADPTVSALEALSVALREVAEDGRLLQERLESLRHERTAGTSWRDILAREEPPGTMQIVSRMLATLARASGTLRKELVDSLRREGVSIPAIARLFGVTHQRVSNLLRRPAE